VECRAVRAPRVGRLGVHGSHIVVALALREKEQVNELIR
jgi:hypothetical protein